MESELLSEARIGRSLDHGTDCGGGEYGEYGCEDCDYETDAANCGGECMYISNTPSDVIPCRLISECGISNYTLHHSSIVLNGLCPKCVEE